MPQFIYEKLAPPFRYDSRLIERILDQADDFGSRPAVADASGSFSYLELRRCALGIAQRLGSAGVGAGDSVIICARLSRWAIPAMLGVLAAGAQYVPIDARMPSGRRQRMAAASKARAMVAESSDADDMRPGFTGPLLLIADSEASATAGRFTMPEVSAASPAYTLYTSGSSGTPKGVIVSRRSLAYSTWSRVAYYEDQPSVFALCSSISFDSSVAGIYWPLAAGAQIVIPSPNPADLESIAAGCEKFGATHILLLPSFYQLLLDLELGSGEPSARLDSLRTVIVAGEPCPPRLVREHFRLSRHASLYNEYGPTEGTVWATVHRCLERDGTGPRVPIGQPIPGTSVHVSATAEGGERAGELWISGPGVASGYAGGTAPRAAFVEHGGRRMYRTGDIVSVGSSDDLRFISRLDDQVKLGGVRMELEEIEGLVLAATGARSAAVGVVRRDGQAQFLMAFVTGSTADFDPQAARTALRRQLPRPAVPRQIVPLAELPRQPNGKLNRKALDELALRHSESNGNPRCAAPR